MGNQHPHSLKGEPRLMHMKALHLQETLLMASSALRACNHAKDNECNKQCWKAALVDFIIKRLQLIVKNIEVQLFHLPK